MAEFNDLADQANGSVLLRYGNTAVMATAVMGGLRDGDFFPLTVDYEERFYATGRILGSRFMRREGRPSTEAILSGRIVDRTIRPLFNQKMRNEVQVVITTLAIDQDDPDISAVIAASLALGVSDIPWNGPASAVRICKNSELLINPDFKAREEAGISIDMIACGKDGMINMIEVGSKEVDEGLVNESLALASAEIEKIQNWQKMIIKDIGKKKAEVELPEATPGTKELFDKEIKPTLIKSLFSNTPEGGKKRFQDVTDSWMKLFEEKFPEGHKGMAMEIMEETVNEVIHDEAIDNEKRADGRGLDEIRPLFVKAGGVSADTPRFRHILSRWHTRSLNFDPRLPWGRPHHRGTDRRGKQAFHAPLQLPAILDRRNRQDRRNKSSHDRSRRIGGESIVSCHPNKR